MVWKRWFKFQHVDPPRCSIVGNFDRDEDNGWNEHHHGWIQKLTNSKVQKNQETHIQNISNEQWKMENMWKTSTHTQIRVVPPRIINQLFPIKTSTNNEHHYLGPSMLQLVYCTHWKPTWISFVTFV